MYTYLPGIVITCCIVALTLAGCGTSGIAHRMQEKSAALAGLDPQVRQHMEMGFVEITYTPDMVYVALGKPSRIEHPPSADGDVEVWVYTNMALPGNDGFRGLRYDSNFEITPSPVTTCMYERPVYDQQQGSKSTITGHGKGMEVDMTAMATSTTIPDMPMGTLYVFFYDGHVFKMTLGD